MAWLKRLYDGETSKWKFLLRLYLNRFAPKGVFENMSHVCYKGISIDGIPRFYLSMINTLTYFNQCIVKHPLGYNEILKRIWGNKMILYNGVSLLYRNWVRAGIRTINDIVIDNRFINADELFTILDVRSNWIAEISLLLKAIPQDWKEKILLGKIEKKSKVILPIQWCISTKQIYWYFIMNRRIEPTKCQMKWHSYFNTEIDWVSTWTWKVKGIRENKLKQINFKLLHNIVPTKKRLYLWKIVNSDKCQRCKNVVQDEAHLFFECVEAKELWKYVNSFIFLKYVIKADFKNIVLGTGNVYVDHIFSLGVFCIFKANVLKNVNKWNRSSMQRLFITEYNIRKYLKCLA
ncbi:uncharacterized protein LOC117110536 [Anneissia japonica]|uniref:uncharacterized protein LOC117110536 n=1 Tax=Anneissia japonica TaxID=1529436 RepID=UPI001425A244|nr:uncharacterized protein LOC117110536 [Anneissia japonica]